MKITVVLVAICGSVILSAEATRIGESGFWEKKKRRHLTSGGTSTAGTTATGNAVERVVGVEAEGDVVGGAVRGHRHLRADTPSNGCRNQRRRQCEKFR